MDTETTLNLTSWSPAFRQAEAPGDTTPGTRRLRDLTRNQQRPLESRLYSLRRIHQKTDAEISHLLDLHPQDLDALAATHGQP